MTEEMRSRLLGMMMARVSRGVFPKTQREPIGYLYGHEAKDGETPTHIINGVGYVGVELPPIPWGDYPGMPFAFISGGEHDDGGYEYHLTLMESFEVKSYGLDVSDYGTAFLVSDFFGKKEWLGASFIYGTIEFYNAERFVWSNFDVVGPDGTFYLEKSAPIPIYGDPVAYRYGTCPEPLPNIYSVYTPEVQAERPYAYLHRKLWGGGYCLCTYSEPCFWDENSLSVSGYSLNTRGDDTSFFFETGGTAWVERECDHQIGIGGVPDTITEGASTELYWTNTGVTNPDGVGMFMEASNPIPIYE